MKCLMRRVDRFCYTHPNFGIYNLMLYIVIGNAIVWLINWLDPSSTLYNLLAFDPAKVFLQGQVWRLVSFIFLLDTSPYFALITLYCSFIFGRTLERAWGKGKFTLYYLCGMLLTIICGVIMWLALGINVSITMPYMNLALVLVFATLYSDSVILLFFIIPLKAKWLGVIMGLYLVYQMIALPFPINLLPAVAILHYLIFCGGWLFDLMRPKTIKQKQKTINYKNAAKQYNRDQARKPYTRKCEVCGVTDADDPNMEFRFCSKCGGYHCFCINHINSHVHFTE